MLESNDAITKRHTPIHTVAPGTMLAEAESHLREYEHIYEMSSERMAKLMEADAIRPTAEVIKWYSTFQGARLLREKTPTTGIPGTTTGPSTIAV